MADIDANAYGKLLSIRGVKHLLLAARGNDLLMLQLKDNGDPCQYVVAHGIYPDRGELSWLNGDYFPLPMYADTAAALKDAVLNLTGDDKNALSR